MVGAAGRPPFEKAGVQLGEDVEPYEVRKLRLPNASHQGMCYFGHLAGYTYAHEAAQDPLFARFLLDYMDKEATPTTRVAARLPRMGRFRSISTLAITAEVTRRNTS